MCTLPVEHMHASVEYVHIFKQWLTWCGALLIAKIPWKVKNCCILARFCTRDIVASQALPSDRTFQEHFLWLVRHTVGHAHNHRSMYTSVEYVYISSWAGAHIQKSMCTFPVEHTCAQLELRMCIVQLSICKPPVEDVHTFSWACAHFLLNTCTISVKHLNT